MVMGQAAGVAARMAAEKGGALHDIDVPAMQAVLRRGGAVLDYEARIPNPVLQDRKATPTAKDKQTTPAR